MITKEDLTKDLEKATEELEKAQKQSESWKVAVLKLAGACDYIKMQLQKIELEEKKDKETEIKEKIEEKINGQ